MPARGAGGTTWDVSQSSGATRSQRRAGRHRVGGGSVVTGPSAFRAGSFWRAEGLDLEGVACLTLLLACSSRSVEPHA